MLEKATEIYLNFTEKSFEFLIKAAMGIGWSSHLDDHEDLAKKSLSFSKSFKPISRED